MKWDFSSSPLSILTRFMHMRSQTELKDTTQVTTAVQRLLSLLALVIGLAALIAGLSKFTDEPIAGVLMAIAAMAVLLYSANGFCGGPKIFQRHNHGM